MNIIHKRIRPEVYSILIRWADRLWPALLVMLCYAVCIRFGYMQYLSNDDSSIQNLLSGCTTGTPFWAHPFVNVLISYPLSRLYSLLPSVQWWYIYSQTLIILGMLFTNYSIAALAKRCAFPQVLAFFTVAALTFSFFLYPVSNVAFTIVPAILGSGIMARLFLLEGEKSSRKLFFLYLFLYVLALCHRAASGKVILCYLLLSLFYLCFSDLSVSFRKRTALFLVVTTSFILLTFLITSGNSRYEANLNGEEYLQYNHARSAYKDFPHDTYMENPELYESVGWDLDLYDLVDHWFFMDDRVTTQSFTYLVENSTRKASTIDISVILACWQHLQESTLVKADEWVWLICAVAALIAVIIQRKPFLLLCFTLNIIGSGFLILYQLYNGRILYRTAVIVLLPSAVFDLLLMIKALERTKRKFLFPVLTMSILLISVLSTVKVASYTFNSTRVQDSIYSARQNRMLNDYAIAHGNTVFIKQSGVSMNTTPWNIYPSEKPINIIGWGGSEFNSYIHRTKLKANGISKLTCEIFRQGNIRYISSESLESAEGWIDPNSVFVKFYKLMCHHYGAVGIIQEDSICDQASVYRFVYEGDTLNGQQVYDYREDHFVETRLPS